MLDRVPDTVKDMALLKVAPESEFQNGGIKEVLIGDAPFAVCNVDGKFHCVEGTCPHAGGPLAEGTLHGNVLVCPWHAWEFDVRTGLSAGEDGFELKTYPVVIENGEVFVDAP